MVCESCMVESKKVLEVSGLRKSFGSVQAVDDISFSVCSGEVFGLLGPNGAGKTTTLKSMLGLVVPDGGLVKIEGFDGLKDPKNARKNVGFLPERVALYQNLTALQNLELFAQVKGVSLSSCIPLLEQVGLADAMNRRVGGFSKGMLQRLGLARALVGSPSVLVLDEPTGGLDPRGVVEIRNQILELKKSGVTVVLSSHILSEVQAVCDRVAIVSGGRLVAVDTIDNLSSGLAMSPKVVLDVGESLPINIMKDLEAVEGVVGVEMRGCMLHVSCSRASMAGVVCKVVAAGGMIRDMQIIEPSLEEVFMKLTSANGGGK